MSTGEGNELATVRKLPGITKYTSIVLKRGLTKNRELWDWRKTVIDGNTARKQGVIVLLGEDRTPVARWKFFHGWPAKWEGPHLKAKANEVAIETLVIEHEGLELE